MRNDITSSTNNGNTSLMRHFYFFANIFFFFKKKGNITAEKFSRDVIFMTATNTYEDIFLNVTEVRKFKILVDAPNLTHIQTIKCLLLRNPSFKT